MTLIGDIAVDVCGKEYLLPYLQREFGCDNAEAESEPLEPRAVVKIVLADDHESAEAQSPAERYASERRLPLSIVRCASIVCTGMQGLPRRIANGIYRGTYLQIAGNEARISLIHATDVARFARMAAGRCGEWTIDDGAHSLINDLADALAVRIADKRLFEIKPRWARWWYGKRYYQELTSDHLANADYAADFPDFVPAKVIDYLRTHNYDEQSL